MNSIKILLIISLLFISSCNINKPKPIKTFDIVENECKLIEALSKNYYTQVNENLGLCITKDTIYLLTNSNLGFQNNTFMFHIMNEDNSFINNDFKKEKYILNQKDFKRIKGLEIISVPLLNKNYNSLRIGQYVRNKNGSTSNIWSKTITHKNIISKENTYKNEMIDQSTINIVNESFLKTLNNGVFFENSNGFYLLYDNGFIYIVGSSLLNYEDKFLLHFIKKDSTFTNESFFAKDFSIQEYLTKPYSNYIVLKKRIIDEEFERIRIGQYKTNENIWIQEFYFNKLKLNPLLVYKNELTEDK